MPGSRTYEIALLDADPDLAADIAPQELDQARARLRTQAVELPTGPWDPPELLRAPGTVLIVGGLVARDIALHGHLGTTLLGPGDLLPAPREHAPAFVRGGVRWSVVEPATIALLDTRFHALARAWPGVGAELVCRGAEQAARHADQQAIAQLPRVEDRVFELLLHLCERWGRVTSAGLELPLRLTHASIGRLIGAKRPTVSLALKALADGERVRQKQDGSWALGVLEAGGRSGVPASPGATVTGARPVDGSPSRGAAADLEDQGRELRRSVERLRARHGTNQQAVAQLIARSAATRDASRALRG